MNIRYSLNISIIICLVFSVTSSFAVGYTPGNSFKIILSGSGKYSYAASTVYDWPYEYHYYCGNKDSNVVVDHIYLKKYNMQTQTWYPPQVMLAPSANQWDGGHICDPAIVKGSFGNGLYQYALFYLGVKDHTGNGNHIGVAFSNSYTGPWHKWSGNPLVIANDPSTHWGVGQPSATAVSGGRVLLFFTRGDTSGTRTLRMSVDFTNLNTPIKGSELVVTKTGLTSRNGGPVTFHNADFVYDGTRDIFIVARERYPFGPDYPDFFASEIQIAWIPGSFIWNGGGSWTVAGNIGFSETMKLRNHNAGIMRNPWGQLPFPNALTIIHASSDTQNSLPGGGLNWLWDFDLYRNDGVFQ